MWRRAIPFICLLASGALVVVVSPPAALVDFLGSDFWARCALALVVFLCLCLVLSVLGLLDGSVTLPFGLSFSRTKDVEAAFAVLGSQLNALHASDRDQFSRLEEIARLQEEIARRMEELEQAQGDRQRSVSGEA